MMPEDQRCPVCKGTGLDMRGPSDVASSPAIAERGVCPICQGRGVLRDAELLAAYQRTTGEDGDAEADALCAEIERRGLGI
jgi:RecJ-like exonuclease